MVTELIADQRERIRQGIARIEQRLQQLAAEHYNDQMQALLSIPGIGKKTAIQLLTVTDGFRRFEDARKLASYVGVCPRIWESGTSVRGRGAISKLGCSQLRKLLYMCSWTAKHCNPGCKKMYDRFKKRGKPEKVIKVAIAHKLLRQAFAVGSRCEPFDEKKYASRLTLSTVHAELGLPRLFGVSASVTKFHLKLINCGSSIDPDPPAGGQDDTYFSKLL